MAETPAAIFNKFPSDQVPVTSQTGNHKKVFNSVCTYLGVKVTFLQEKNYIISYKKKPEHVCI